MMSACSATRASSQGDEWVLVVLETLREQIARADTELKVLTRADVRMRRLMTVPGVGPVTAARFVAALDDVDRFPNAASVASCLGLIPGENTTGFRAKRTRLSPPASRAQRDSSIERGLPAFAEPLHDQP